MRITVQVTASRVNAAMVAATHQTQVLPAIDFKLMIFPLRMLNPTFFINTATLASNLGVLYQ